MSQKQKAMGSEGILSSSEIIRLTSEKPVAMLPLWELLAGFAFALIFSLLFYFGHLSRLENATIDFRFRQRGHLPQNQDIVLVSITDECIEELGAWPWPRKMHGDLLNVLRSAGAKTVAFDIIFNDSSLLGEADDQEMARQIRNFGRVVLPLILQEKTILDNETGDMVNAVVPERPVSTLLAASPSEGFIDLDYKTLNPDGVIRKLLLNREIDGNTFNIFGLAAAADYLGSKPVVEIMVFDLATDYCHFLIAMSRKPVIALSLI